MKLTVDVKQIVEATGLLRNFQAVVPEVLSKALNHAGAKARTVATRKTAEVMSLGVGKVRPSIYSIPAKPWNPIYQIVAQGKPIRLKEFHARPGPAGVTATIMSRAQLFRHTFIVEKLNAQVFKRAEPSPEYQPRGGFRKHGLPIRVLSGPAVSQVLLDKRVTEAVDQSIAENLPGRIGHEIGRIFRKSG